MKNIKIVYGRNGSDLHRRIRTKAAEFARRASDGERAVFIVPDQYTLTAERFLLSELGEKEFHKLRVVSFKRLAALTFAECGKTFDFVGEGGRAALVSAAFDDVSPQLKYYAGYSDFYFNEALCERIKMFKEYSVSPDALLSAETSDAVRDLALIYGMYDSLLGADRADSADNLRLFAELIAERGLFRDATVFIDFFKVLNASELSVVRALCEMGADICVGLVSDGSFDENGLFAPVCAVEKKLASLAARLGGRVIREKAESGTEYLRKGPARLESFLATDAFSGSDDGDGVEIYKATDISDEVDFVCCRVCKLVLDCGFRFSDIAVVTRDDARYAPYFEKIFADYSIPFFRHKKSGALEKKAVRFIGSLFAAVRFGFRRDDVLDVVRCGFIKGVGASELAEFERYVLIWNVNGKGFFEPFERSVRGFSGGETPSPSDAARLLRAENVRQKVCGILSFLGKGSEKASVKSHAERLFGLFETLDLERRIKVDSESLAAMGEKTLAEESEKLFELLVRGLDEYVLAVGESEVSLDMFGRMYLRIISEYSVGSIPTSSDAVLIGGADTAPLLEKRAVFVLGLREGAFPKTPTSSPLVPEKERAALEEQGITVDIAPFEKFLYEQFIVYYALTSATERVYMSYPSTDGGESVACEAFDLCLGAFPRSEIKTGASSADRLYRTRPAVTKAVAYGIRELSDYFGLRIADGREYPQSLFSVPKEVAEKLYGSPVYVSATKSDTFAECPYRYFVRFGLGVDELQKAEFSAVNVGSLVHAALDRIFKKEKDLAALDNEALAAVAEKEVGAYMREAFGADAERRDMLVCADSVRKRLFSLLCSMRDELRATGYRPVYTELGIGRSENGLPAFDLDCENGVKARITGSIDRVDALDDGGRTYVRVIDYKTGNKDFSLADIYRGLSVQLPLYLDILSETGGELFSSEPKPAGMMYYLLNREFETGSFAAMSGSAYFAENGTLPSLPPTHRRSGMILEGEELMKKVDPSGKYFVDKDVAKCFFSADERDFETVFSDIKKTVRGMCVSLTSGRFEKTPKKRHDRDCGYCPFTDICENSERCVSDEKMRNDDALKRMREDLKNETEGENNG